MTGPENANLLCELAAFGPYFELTSELDESGWVPFHRLLDAEVLLERVDGVRSTLAARGGRPKAEIDVRACASIHFLAIASRLLAPALAVISTRGRVLDPDPAGVWWQPVDGGPIPFAWTALDGAAAASPEQAAELVELGVLGRLVAPLAARFGETFRVSDQVLLGNAASALAGAAIMLRSRPKVLDPTDVVSVLVSRGRLAGTGGYRGQRRFIRNNCCLLYRIAGSGTCGDCVLTHRVIAS